MIRIIVAVVLLIFFCGTASGEGENSFSTEQVGFAVKIRGEIFAYNILAVFVLPEEKVAVSAVSIEETAEQGTYQFDSSAGTTTQTSPNTWEWIAPSQPDLYQASVRNNQSEETIALNIFVMVPYTRLKGESLNGYRIGKYSDVPFKGLSIYKKPRGFIEVTEENENTQVSPHFTLNQFLCKQQGGYPKYLVLRERLLLKLELILEKVNASGYSCSTFDIMSGYRTPYYNKVIGNVKYSRHVWGGAADFFIDESPRDGMMDDLNGDGTIDYRDAHIIYEIVDSMFGKPWYEDFVGGLGRYKKNNNHGPFVHIDVRGFRARWGT